MELELYRHDVLQSSTCARGTLAVLPFSEERKPQKIAMGDLQGVIQCASLKKGEIVMSFKTLPGVKVTSLSLGKGKQQRDRIFVAAGNTIKGISKKGKEFFKFNTQITETIKKVDVYDKFIWSSAEFVHNQFVEAKDKAFYLCPDRINDAEIVPLLSPHDWSAALACQDRHMRLLSGDQLLYEVATPSAPTCVRYVPESHDAHHMYPAAKELLYGTESGTVVQLLLEMGVARQGFTLPNPKKLGAINAIYSGLDLSKSGCTDIVVGREDGSLEVYDMDEAGGLQQIYSTRLSESICTLDGGCITTASLPEVVLHTFSGKVLTYGASGTGMYQADPTDPKRPRGAAAVEDDQRRQAYEAQVAALRQELLSLQGFLEVEKKSFGERQGNTAVLAAVAPFTVQDRCKLEAEEACYVLALEVSVPIFAVALQATLKLVLLDVPSNVAIISRSPPDEANGNLTLATYRCQDATSRLSIKFKVREGNHGSLLAFIVPNISPKHSISVSHKIKPLCLHQRVTEADTTRPTNELVITGSFSITEMHAWVDALLPETPPKPMETEMALVYKNTLLGTQLTARYRAGEARFTSDLITTLGIIHDYITKEATQLSKRINVMFAPNSAALQHSIQAVWPQLHQQRMLKSQVELLEGLLELRMQDPDVGSYLTPEQKKILDNADQLREEYKTQPQHLDHLCDLVKELYQDFCKLAGITAPRSRLPALDQMLKDTSSTLDQVIAFMMKPA